MLSFRKSLLARIVFSFSLLSLMIVLLLSVFSYALFIRGTEGRLISQLTAVAADKTDALNRWVDEQARKVAALAVLPEVRRGASALCSPRASDSERASAYLAVNAFFDQVAPYYPELQNISILSTEGGKVMFSTDAPYEGGFHVLETSYLEGKKATFVHNFYPSPSTLQPTMTVSTPLRDAAGAVAGVLVADLLLDTMDRIIVNRSGLTRTGEIYLVDKYNVFVSARRFGRDGYPRGAHSKGIDDAVSGINGAGMYRNYRGVPVIGVYRWIPEREVALLLEVGQEEAFGSARLRTLYLVVIGLALVLVSAVAVILLARRITAPILAVREAALRVTAGDLTAQAPRTTVDEIGDLALSFNRMTVKVKALYDDLRSAEEHFRSLIESSSDIVAVIDVNMRLSFVNSSVEQVLGYNPREMLGMDLASLLHPDDREGARTTGRRLVQSGDGLPVVLQFRAACKDGTWRTLEVTARNLLDHPAIAGVICSARDISERQRLEEMLAQALKMEAVGRLAGGIAHDFNNLLTAVLGYSDALLEEIGLSAEARDFVGEIKTAAHRAASLTRQLLAYSRKQLLQLRNVDLNALVTGMQSMLRRLIGENIELTTSLCDGLRSVSADPGQLEQVIMNLALNARDAMPDGGAMVFRTENADLAGDARDEHGGLPPGPYVVLSVSDTGCGMDAELLPKIFEPFFTTKEVGKGTGLGLATVYGIIKQSGGHVSVESARGKGSTFRIILPALSTQPPLSAKNAAGPGFSL